VNAPSFGLIETMRWDGRTALLGCHLARLKASAETLGFRYAEPALLAGLDAATRRLGEREPQRLRLTLAFDGSASFEATPLAALPLLRTAAVHPTPVVAGGPFWRHKTTRRAHYEGPLAWARHVGADEAILVDLRGEVVEATRSTVWVESRGRLLTPPLAAGGLPGVFRAHLLATRPEAAEAPLTVDDLNGANSVYLSNAVRGLFRVDVVRRGAWGGDAA
jgi:para-aminobenzoate synthetase/4-amino-4-deoxychorismate lyase